MTSKLEETLNLPPMEDLDNEDIDFMDEEEECSGNLPASSSLSYLSNLKEDQHDREADDIRIKALKAFEDIMEVGRNVNPERSARLFEVAGQFLKTGLDAANSKAEKQLKAAKLKLEAKRLKVDDEMIEQISHGREVIADRNELLKQMLSEAKVIDVDVKKDDNN